MEIETCFKVEYEDCIGDHFPDDMHAEDINKLIEEHLKDYCKEHKIDRSCITIINKQR